MHFLKRLLDAQVVRQRRLHGCRGGAGAGLPPIGDAIKAAGVLRLGVLILVAFTPGKIRPWARNVGASTGLLADTARLWWVWTAISGTKRAGSDAMPQE